MWFTIQNFTCKVTLIRQFHTKIYCIATISLTNYSAHISKDVISQLVLFSHHVHTAARSHDKELQYTATKVCYYITFPLGLNKIGQLLFIVSILLSRTISKLYGLGCLVSTEIRLHAGLTQKWGSIPSKNFSLSLCPAYLWVPPSQLLHG
jgi:hypothetical protein